MLNYADIVNSVWISKQKAYILGLETKNSYLKQVLYHIEKKKTKSIIFKDNKIYKSGSKIPLNDPKEHAAFVKRMHQIFDDNPYWSTITTPKYNDKKLSEALTNYLEPDSVRQKIAKFAKKICKADTFDTRPFYKHQATSTKIKNQILASMSTQPITKEANGPPKSSTSTVSIDTMRIKASESKTSNSESAHIDSNESNNAQYNFSELKESCLKLIEEICEGKPALKIISNNPSLDYTYTATIDKNKILFLKTAGYQKQELILKFDEGSLTINSIKSNQSNDIFINYFNQMIK